ncbi:MAG: hypothetical protein HOD92_23140 [Deltaproteobacteria bacterium]|jgi:hypothetical protein|nr:hypothetical protein [Deltaproteobacteria bacterium]MBT4527244.1 hypothetical protein [Deltaproteobacteria bacterium]
MKCMKGILLFTGFYFVFFSTCRAEAHIYRHYYPNNNRDYGTNEVWIGELIDNQRLIKTRFQETENPENISTSESLLDQNYELIQTRIRKGHIDSDYQVKKTDQFVFIFGKRKGKSINKKLELTDNPFYWDPKLGLSGFVKSSKTSLVFQVIRPDNQKVYEMKAERIGLKNISINGKKIVALEIYWSLTGFLSIFFDQTYYYRASDGLFLTQKKPFENKTMELILE